MKRRPRIGLVVPSLAWGGGVPAVARFIKQIVERCGEFELKPVSLATSMSDANSMCLLRPGSWLRGITISSGSWEGLAFSHVGAFACELEFQRFRPRQALAELLADCDLIQVVSGTPAWALAVLGLGKPVALQVATRAIVERRRRERIERGPAGWWRSAMTRVTDAADDRALKSVDTVLVENTWMLDYARGLRPDCQDDVRFAPPGIDTALFHPLAQRVLDPPGRGYILCVGRFDDARKNVDMLLDAYARLHHAMGDPPRLQLAGAGQPGTRFWEKVHDLGLEAAIKFHFHPSTQELVAYYQNALCFALSSEEEGFGIVLAEAMACGIPVVATRCGGPQVIISEGVDGDLVDIGDAAAMCERLRSLVQDSARNRAMGEAARATAQRRFASEVAGEAFLDVYRRLLSAC